MEQFLFGGKFVSYISMTCLLYLNDLSRCSLGLELFSMVSFGFVSLQHQQTRSSYHMYIQVNRAITDFKGPTKFIHYRRISAIAIKRNKEKHSQGTEKPHLLSRRIFVTLGSVIAGFNCFSDYFNWSQCGQLKCIHVALSSFRQASPAILCT